MSLNINALNCATTQKNDTIKNNCSNPSFGIKANSEKLAGQPSKDTVDLQVKTGCLTDNIDGEIDGKDFSLDVKSNLLGKKTIGGTIDGKNFEIISTNKGITGMIGDKPVNIEFKAGNIKNFLTGKYSATGTIGEEKINLMVDKEMFSQSMTGTFKNKKVDLHFGAGLGKSVVIGNIDKDIVNMKFKNNGIFKNGMNVKGTYSGDKEFFPILISSFYANESNANANAAMLAC